MKKNAVTSLMKLHRFADITAELAGALAVLMAQIECYAGIARWQIMQQKERIRIMKYKLEKVSSEEQAYLYAPAENDVHSKTRIGHLRGDFGLDGDEFWHTWFPFNEEMNVPKFKIDLGEVVEWLRSDTEYPLLKDRKSMDAVCRRYPENRMENQWHADWYCFKIITEKYMYFIRCFTGRGDYNFYVYCYIREEAEELIRYHVGQVFDKKLDGDGAIFEMSEDMGHIYIGFTDITEEEISVINSGKLDIGLSVIEGVIFITASFDDRLVMDVPFYAGLYPVFHIKDPAPYGYTVPIVAVDNRTNVIKALRVVGFDPAFSAMLYSLAKEQWDGKPIDYKKHLPSILIRYSTEEIVNAAIMKNKVEVRL